ncbi:MAG: proline iminopeptidase-family hydrolase [Longimicrobiales bacterium]|nr:proline iminopeptidase-family hydrolase [Longimicrobiales bacterium]
MKLLAVMTMAVLLPACAGEAPPPDTSAVSYFDNTGRTDVLSGGVSLIPIETPSGTFRVWTKRVGNNPTIKVLLLHGGPAATHEYFEAADSYLPAAGVEYYYYDQLGSAYSDQPDVPELWTIEHFVDEVEQVRVALGLDASNFYLLGHSWGGILAMEYALAHGENLKGLVISNMMASIPAYNEYARNVLMPTMDQGALAEIQAIEAAKDFQNPRYMELLVPNHYEHHILRMPASEWPDPVNRAFAKLNYSIYLAMQGPSELGASGSLEQWDRTGDLKNITVPTLVVGAQHDTMDPAHMEWMAGELHDGRYLFCANGSHMAMYDDQATYFEGLVRFLKEVDAGGSDQPPGRS